ncbi:MAG: hypothetical protein ACREV4_01595 [Gammaproteobacteria bacterium]
MSRGKQHPEPLFCSDAIVIPAGCTRWIENVGDEPLEFAVIVSPPWQAEDGIRVA